jgi:hypothetical protein
VVLVPLAAWGAPPGSPAEQPAVACGGDSSWDSNVVSNGIGVRVTEECLRPDLDFDGDADLTDFRILQAGFESPP